MKTSIKTMSRLSIILLSLLSTVALPANSADVQRLGFKESYDGLELQTFLLTDHPRFGNSRCLAGYLNYTVHNVRIAVGNLLVQLKVDLQSRPTDEKPYSTLRFTFIYMNGDEVPHTCSVY